MLHAKYNGWKIEQQKCYYWTKGVQMWCVNYNAIL